MKTRAWHVVRLVYWHTSMAWGRLSSFFYFTFVLGILLLFLFLSVRTTIGSISALGALIHGGLMIIDLVISRLLPIFISDCEICQHPQDGLASLRTNICSSQEINTPTFVVS